MEYLSLTKKNLSLRKKGVGFIIIPIDFIDDAVVKGKYIHIALKNDTVFKCQISEAKVADIEKIFVNKDKYGNRSKSPLYRNITSASVKGKRTTHIRTEQLILSWGLFLLAFFIPAIVSQFTADPERRLSLSSSLIFLLINFSLYYLIASAFSKTKKQETIHYFHCHSKWLHLQTDRGIYYSIRKDFIRAVYQLNGEKYILLKNNDGLPCSDDYISDELASMKIKRERKWLRWVLLVLYIPLSVILTVIYLLFLF